MCPQTMADAGRQVCERATNPVFRIEDLVETLLGRRAELYPVSEGGRRERNREDKGCPEVHGGGEGAVKRA